MKFDKGSYVVLPTPFKFNRVDYNSLEKLIYRILDSDVKGIVILGTTSESPTLSLEEKKKIVYFVRNIVQNTKTLIIGVGGNNTFKTLEFALYCSDKCHGLLVTVPNYNKPSQEGIFHHFCKISNHTKIRSIPIMMYNVPSRCGVNMEPETIRDLFKICGNIVAIKEASGSISQVIKIKSLCDIQIFSGDDYLIIPIMSLGGCGVISVAGNVFPNKIEDIVRYCLDGKYEKARELFFCLDKFIENLFIETNPTPLKQILQEKKIFDKNDVRLPLFTLNIKNKDLLLKSYFETLNVLSQLS